MKVHRRITRSILILVTGFALAGPALAASDGCVTANVPGPIVLPDGRFYPAGQIRLCLSERLSPVAGLHEASVAGFPIGMFLSRASRIEATLESHPTPLFYFLRTGDGAWILEAYSIPAGDRSVLYQLRKAAPRSPGLEADRAAEGTPAVLTASAGR